MLLWFLRLAKNFFVIFRRLYLDAYTKSFPGRFSLKLLDDKRSFYSYVESTCIEAKQMAFFQPENS